MRPPRDDIAVPDIPPGTAWLNGEPAPMPALTARGPVLVHFFDFAQLNSVRALPYVLAWHERYADRGLTVVGVHSPRFPFTADPATLGAALDRLDVRHPVAGDADYAIWHAYGCEGWPSLFLWGRGGALRWFHFGEGEYEATERAIQDELPALSPGLEPPPPIAPLRPTDAPAALVAPPTGRCSPAARRRSPGPPASLARRSRSPTRPAART